MEVLGNYLYDKKVESKNYLVEMSIGEYFEITKTVLNNNEFQRPRVTTTKTIYNMLGKDLVDGCLIPALVLAIPYSEDNQETPDDLCQILMNKKDDVLILDGLQRTYTIIDLLNSYKTDISMLEKIKNQKVRVEIYYNIKRTNILYRMLTLNTGHKQMSTRHQIEIVYSDLQSSKPENVNIIKDTDINKQVDIDTYKYNDLIDGFTSFLDKDYLPIDREDILNCIKNIETLNSSNKDKANLFSEFISVYNTMAHKFLDISEEWKTDDDYPITKPYGLSIEQIFSKPQTMAGFGAAISELMNSKELDGFDSLRKMIQSISSSSMTDSLNKFNEYMSEVSKNAKKIGNDQRLFLYSLFLNLFSDSKCDFDKAVESANRRYLRETR